MSKCRIMCDRSTPCHLILEAVDTRGYHVLIPRSAILRATEGALNFRGVCHGVAGFMAIRGYVKLTSIQYFGDGSQVRAVICERV